ncbi:MAG: hypothetical protein ACR2OO_08525 [Thermomicrobiales bacterium]
MSAQKATPTAAPYVPSPGRCTAEPMRPGDMGRIVATPDATAPAAPAKPIGVLPKGTPADPQIAIAVAELIDQYVACFNRNDLGRVLALYSDAAIRRLDAMGDALLLNFLADRASPTPFPAERWTGIIDVRDVRIFPDGRAGATLSLHYPGIPVPKHFFMTFVAVDGRWLIDDVLGEISFSVP